MQEPIPTEFKLENLSIPVPTDDQENEGFDKIVDATNKEQGPLMEIYQVRGKSIANNVHEVMLLTNRGVAQGMLSVSPGNTGVVLWVPGGGLNFNGPARGVYAELACDLQAAGISSLRMGYRDQESFNECVLDTLAWLSFLRGTGAESVILGGNGLGSSVATCVASIDPLVKGLIAISSREIEDGPDQQKYITKISPKPLLIVHGEKDTRNPVDLAQQLYKNAGDPKELVLYPEAGALLAENASDLHEKLGSWISDQLGKSSEYASSISEKRGELADLVRQVPKDIGGSHGLLVLSTDDMLEMGVDAIISTTGTWLNLQHNALSGEIVQRGGSIIQDELSAQEPVFVGDIAVTTAGDLKATHIFHAITGGQFSGEPQTMDEIVAITTRDSLARANSMGLRTVALPAIGSGNRGFPIEKAAQIMVTIAAAHLAGPTSVEKITFSVVSNAGYNAFESLLKLLPE